ncbi:MAG: LptF/LptG family permease [Candidatus Omnitrophica bacterium]|nr:LptF/LptG family permease [Candidatus Omnitrophota bacterium]MCM8770587.1 LptF/LptG family permease [Candidatus Omnitrophota bacterium]
MKILRNYILNEFMNLVLLAVALLTFVMLLGNLVKITDLVINKGVDIFSVGKLFLYLIPDLFVYTLPIAVLSAIMLSLGRLSHDNEIIAIRSGGINLMRIIFPLLIMAVIFSLLLVIFNTSTIPYVHYARRKALIDVGVKNPTAALEAGVFINSFDKYILFIYEIKGNQLFNIRIYEPTEGGPTRTIVAKKGEFISNPEEKIVRLKLIDGSADEPDPKNPKNFYKLHFKTNFLTLNLAQKTRSETIEKKPKDMTSKELDAEAKKIKSQGIDPTPLLTEAAKRISLAFSCVIFVLIGSPLAIITKRRERSINFALAFLIAGVYYLLLLASEALSLQGHITPQLAMWLPNIIIGLIGVILTIKLCVY